ncbi:MAG: hybrid sensor histidine kinase/response regulator [Kofleriaceae bacterium]
MANPVVPLRIADPATDEPRATVSAAHSLAPTGARILIVDDNARVRRSTAAALSRIGFHVMTAEDGAPAIQIAESTPPDLAVVDYEMPTPGIIVVKRLKELYGPACWVAVLSGDDSDDMRNSCFDAGADDVIAKPVPIPELHRRMVAAARTQRAFVESRIARERTDRLLAYGAEAAAMLAHDLNNGLAVALCNMDYLEGTATGLDTDQSQALTSTRNALRRMSGLVANFVDIARFEDAAVKPHCTMNQVKGLLESVIEVHAVGCKVKVGVDCEPELTGWFDVALIERVLHNLVGNAVRYCRADGEIRLSAKRLDVADPQSVEISVFNNGPTIPPELEKNLFGKYSKGSNGKRGFGLYFCRLACEAHNGRIMYRGESDGSSFVIRLPGRG